jgi:acylphosphatase
MGCAKFVVFGKVQGVFFRASARAEALHLGLTGYAKNLDDGSVEVVACGDAQALDQLAAWLQHGPPHARVDRLIRSTADEISMDGSSFRTL